MGKRTYVKWRFPNCGGREIFGSPDCFITSDGTTSCFCKKELQHNYLLWYKVASAVRESPVLPHTMTGENGVRQAWDDIATAVKKNPEFYNFDIQGKAVQDQWIAMLSDYSNRHSDDNSSVIESTPFDELVRYLRDQMYERQSIIPQPRKRGKQYYYA